MTYQVPKFVFIRLKVKTNDSGLNWHPVGTILPAVKTKLNAHINEGISAYGFTCPKQYHGAVPHYDAKEVSLSDLTPEQIDALDKFIDDTYEDITNLRKAEYPILKKMIFDARIKDMEDNLPPNWAIEKLTQ